MSNPARKAYYAEARRLTRRPRWWRHTSIREGGPYTIEVGGVTYSGPNFSLTVRKGRGIFNPRGPITTTWEAVVPKADFASFEIPPSPPPDEQFCEPGPRPERCQITGECIGYLRKGSVT